MDTSIQCLPERILVHYKFHLSSGPLPWMTVLLNLVKLFSSIV